MSISIHLTDILLYSALSLVVQPLPAQAETCSQTVQRIDSQHRKALDNYRPGSDEYMYSLYAIEDSVFPALERCPNNASLMAAMSELQLSLGQPPIALLYAQKALKYDPNNWQAHNAAGNALNVMERYREGLQHLQRASELQPDNYALLINLCSSYEQNQQHTRAIQSCSRVIEKGPSDLRGTAYYLRARAYQARGELEHAASDDKHARELGFRGQTGIIKGK
jgi:tetratricopeptide (TPR) repeat protein